MILGVSIVWALSCGVCFADTKDASENSWDGGEHIHQAIDQIFTPSADETVSGSEEFIKTSTIGKTVVAIVPFRVTQSICLTPFAQLSSNHTTQGTPKRFQFLCSYRL